MTQNGAWHNLDCSAICPAGTKIIKFRVTGSDDTVDTKFYLRINGATNTIAAYGIWTQVAGQTLIGNFDVPCDTNRVVEYSANQAWTALQVTVTGWEGYISTTETDVEDDLAALEARVTVNEGDIDVLEGEMDAAEARITINEGNIATLSVQSSRVLNVYNEAATPDEWRVINGRWVKI